MLILPCLTISLLSAPLPAQGDELGAAFELPEGLEATLWAESPAVFNPTAIDVDARGRLWVTEAVNYRQWGGRNPGLHRDGGDRVVILEDTDADGVCDSHKVFVQDPDLVAPLGIALVGDTVYVSCSPNLFAYVDEDGDDVADRRETILTGFGGFDHDHGLHSVVPHADGKLYCAVGNAGPHLVTGPDGWTLRSGSLYSGGGPKRADNRPGLISDDGQVWTGGLILRFDHDGSNLEVLAHNFRNIYEVALDRDGEMFTADNDDDGNRSCRTTWVMPGGNYGYFSADGSRAWQADRRPGLTVQEAHWHQRDPGVVPAGTINGGGGPTGVAVYEGELLSDWIGGAVLNCDAGARVVYAHRPRPVGSGILLDPGFLIRAAADAEGETGLWFRPSDVVVGPAGDVYVADWYDPGVGGHAARDRAAYGRILRIAPAGATPPIAAVDLDSTEGLVAALDSPAVSVRELARQRLGFEAPKDDPVLGPLLEPTAQRRALYALARRSEPVDPALVYPAISTMSVDDPWLLEMLGQVLEPGADAVYAELIAEFGDTPLLWDARFEALAWRLHPRSAVAAFQARAMSPQLEESARRRAIDALAFTQGRAAADAVMLVATAGPDDLRGYASWWIEHRATNDWRDYGLRLRTGDLADAELAWQSDVMRRGSRDVDLDVSGADRMWLIVTDGGDGNSYDWAAWARPRVRLEDGSEVALGGKWREAKTGWGSVNVNADASGGALEIGETTYAEGIGTHAPSEVAFDLPRGATRLLCTVGPEKGGTDQSGGKGTSLAFEVWLQREPEPKPLLEWVATLTTGDAPGEARALAVSNLAADPQGALLLIQAKADGRIPDPLVADAAAQLFRNPDLAVRALASQHFERPGMEGRDLPSIAELMKLEGDAGRGRALFQDQERARCLSCHAFESGDARIGIDLGPELTLIHKKLGGEALYDAILNPSASIAFGYDTYLLKADDGLLYSGFLLADGDTVALLSTDGDRIVFSADEVVSRKKQEASTMPEGVALDLTAQDLADLVAFLSEDPAREPRYGDEVVLFDGASMDAWTHWLSKPGTPFGDVWSVENGVLRCEGRPTGYLKTRARYTSYRLTLEWRFDPAAGPGNSGVLLRQTGPDRIWPKSIEAQLQHRSAGDFWNIEKVGMRPDPGRTSGRNTRRAAPSSEHPVGEWNRYDILVEGPRVELRVNGVLQNAADWCDEVEGHICLQSEGAVVEFRDIRLRPILD